MLNCVLITLSIFYLPYRLIRVEKGNYEWNSLPLGYKLDVSTSEIAPFYEKKHGIGWINYTNFLVGNLIIDTYTLKVTIVIK